MRKAILDYIEGQIEHFETVTNWETLNYEVQLRIRGAIAVLENLKDYIERLEDEND
jgi:hypothetical protein